MIGFDLMEVHHIGGDKLENKHIVISSVNVGFFIFGEGIFSLPLAKNLLHYGIHVTRLSDIIANIFKFNPHIIIAVLGNIRIHVFLG